MASPVAAGILVQLIAFPVPGRHGEAVHTYIMLEAIRQETVGSNREIKVPGEHPSLANTLSNTMLPWFSTDIRPNSLSTHQNQPFSALLIT